MEQVGRQPGRERLVDEHQHREGDERRLRPPEEGADEQRHDDRQPGLSAPRLGNDRDRDEQQPDRERSQSGRQEGSVRRADDASGEGSQVRDPPQGAMVDVGVVQPTVGPDDEVDNRDRALEQANRAWIGQAVGRRGHHEQAATRKVGEEERTAVLGRKGVAS